MRTGTNSDPFTALQARVCDLEAQVAAQKTQNDAFASAVAQALQTLHQSVEQAGSSQQQGLFHLLELTDAMKSKAEVSDELVGQWRQWRQANPIPATPLVSVCVATYNRARLLTERCLPSILRQSYANFELIVVGDGCSDDTERRVLEINDPRIRFVNLAERGVYPDDLRRRWMVAGTTPVNHALKMARGYFVTHLDDDDEYLPARLERLVRFAQDNDADFVWHPFWTEQPGGDWELNASPQFAYCQMTTSSVFYRRWFTTIRWDIEAHKLQEPGDWNRFRKIKYLDPVALRFPDPLLRHYTEHNQPKD